MMQRRNFLAGLMGVAGFSLPVLAKRQKPVDEILLLECYVAGYQFYQGESVQQQFMLGDSLSLRAEPNNPHDELAVEIYWNAVKLGYVPRQFNGVIAQLFQRRQNLIARVAEWDEAKPSWRRMKINVLIGG